MNPHIQAHKADLHALCRTYGVERLELFGSVATEAFDAASSDLGFIVEFADKPSGYAGCYLDFAETRGKRRWLHVARSIRTSQD